MRLPRISVITPSLSQGRFIEDAILSVAKQGYPNFEHIVVDGCSADNTLAVLRSHAHLRWISEPDKGQADALNKGFQMANGDLLGWLNADEYYLPGAFEAVAKFALANPTADVFYGDSIFVNEQGRLRRGHKAHKFNSSILLYYGCFIPTDALFFRRHLIEREVLLDTNYRIVMDFEYLGRLAALGMSFKYINRFLGSFRWHDSNVSLQDDKRRKERMMAQRAWNLITLSDHSYDTLAQIARLYRIALKIFNGNYYSELMVRRFRGSETRWFRSDEGRRTCAALLA